MSKQKLFDKLKLLREQGEVWLTIGKERVKVVLPDKHEHERWGPPLDAIVNINGRVRLETLVTKDAGSRYRVYGKNRFVGQKQIIGKVVERYNKKKEFDNV